MLWEIVLSAVLTVLSFPAFNFSFLAWFALVPLLFAIRRQSPRQAFRTGWLTGTLAYTGILYWLIPTFQAAHQSIFLATACLLLLAAYLGLFWGAWVFLTSVIPATATTALAVRQRLSGGKRSGIHGSPLTTAGMTSVSAACSWVALEYLRTYLFSGFPWALLGDTQWPHRAIIQIASLTGVYGVSFLVILVNGALFLFVAPVETGAQSSLKNRLWIPAFAGMTILMIYLFGLYRLHAYSAERPASKPLHVVLLQGSIDQYKKWDKAYVEDIQHTYEKLNAAASSRKPDLILWPETSVPGYLLQEPSLREWLTRLVRKTGTYHIIGAPTSENGHAYNSAFGMGPSGDVLGRYDKRHLVPFGEIVPWASVLSRWIRALNDLGGFAAGERAAPIAIPQARVGVNICYEAIFPNLIRQSVRQGAEIIANMTNDGWYVNGAEAQQHFIPNVFRAVENDRWVLRADNTGISGIIDPTGAVQSASPIFHPMIVEGTAYPRLHQTPYTRFGDVFAWGCIAITLIILL